MRFRSKFEWPLLGACVIWFGLCLAWFHKQPHEAIGWAYLFIGIVQLLLVAWTVAGYFFFWWEIGERGLVQRMFWSERAQYRGARSLGFVTWGKRSARAADWFWLTDAGGLCLTTASCASNLSNLMNWFARFATTHHKQNLIFFPPRSRRVPLSYEHLQ